MPVTQQKVPEKPPSGGVGELASLPRRRFSHVRPTHVPQCAIRRGTSAIAWLTDAIDTLVAAETNTPLAGDALVHLDVRSDNLCFVEERVVLVDWNWACRGNRKVDIAAWLPSLLERTFACFM